MRTDIAKLLIAVAIDIIDFTVGRIFGAGTALDIIFAILAVILWGPAGLIAFWEVADPSGQIDAFVPTMTLIALSQMGKAKKTKPL